MRLNVKAFLLTSGIVWGVGLMLLTWWMILMNGPGGDGGLIGQVYKGYGVSWTGSLVGLAWGLPDGAICGAIFAGLYNYFQRRFGG